MAKQFLFILLFLANALTSFAQKPIGIGQWRTHLPYNSVVSVTEAPDVLYVASEASFYSFNLNTGEIELFSKVDGFSDVEISKLAYSWEKDILFIGYKNTNIDLLVKGKTIVNIPDVFREAIVGVKEINDVYFYQNVAFVSTTFGIVEVDLAKFEIKGDYRRIGPMGQLGQITPVRSVCVNEGIIYATTPDGVVSADVNANLSDASSWSLNLSNDFTLDFGGGKMINFKGQVYAQVDTSLRVFDGNSWGYFQGSNVGHLVSSMIVNQNKLVIATVKEVWVIDENLNRTPFDLRYSNSATIDKSGFVWAGGDGTGLIKRDQSGNTGYVQPNGPFAISTYKIYQHFGSMWVTGGGVTDQYQPAFNNAGIYYFSNGTWSNYRSGKPELESMRDFLSMAVNERTGDIFFGSHSFGVAHILNGQVVEVYDESNSTLSSSGGFTSCPGVAVDEDGNLWVTNFNEGGNLEALSVRKPNGDWKSFELPDAHVGQIIVDEEGQKWMASPTGAGIIVFKDLDGVDGNTTRTRVLSTGERNGDLPSSYVNKLLLDEDGEIWVGTETGLCIFYNPGKVFEGGLNGDAQQIIIDDGKDVGYLLGTEVINDMALDGANRKWVATNTGVWLIESDGTKILKHFTTRNSPLLSNTVKCVGIDQKTGEVYFGTDKGIISYRGDATEAGDKHGDVVVFPNPVREDYNGVITITGLPRNATVKITDVAGRVVYEMISDGGTAVWNGLSFGGSRPATGIYLIFTANEDDEDALVSKLLIVN